MSTTAADYLREMLALRAENESLRAEVAKLRPIVQAAREWKNAVEEFSGRTDWLEPDDGTLTGAEFALVSLLEDNPDA